MVLNPNIQLKMLKRSFQFVKMSNEIAQCQNKKFRSPTFEPKFQQVCKIFRFWLLCILKALILSFLKIHCFPFVYEVFGKYVTFNIKKNGCKNNINKYYNFFHLIVHCGTFCTET